METVLLGIMIVSACSFLCAGISSIQSSGLLDRMVSAWDNPAKPLAREGAVLAFAALVKQLGEAGEPYLMPLMPKLLERYADKARMGLGGLTCNQPVSVTSALVQFVVLLDVWSHYDRVTQFCVCAAATVFRHISNTCERPSVGSLCILFAFRSLNCLSMLWLTLPCPTLQAPPVRAQAETAARQFVRGMSPHATPLLLPTLFEAMDAKRQWQIKASLQHLAALLWRTFACQVFGCLCCGIARWDLAFLHRHKSSYCCCCGFVLAV